METYIGRIRQASPQGMDLGSIFYKTPKLPKRHSMRCLMGDSCIKPLSLVETCKNFINVTLFWFYGDQMSIYQIIWNASLLDSIIKLERFGPGAKESTFIPDLSSLPPFPLWTLGPKTETIYWIYHSRPLGVDTLSPEPVPENGRNLFWSELVALKSTPPTPENPFSSVVQ